MARSVLVVDDHSELREALAQSLLLLGCSVESAGNAVDALDLLRGGLRPHLVLLDLAMPGFDGYDFLRAQEQDPELAAVPVVVITGRAAERPKGSRLMLTKPVTWAQLEDLVARYCPAAG